MDELIPKRTCVDVVSAYKKPKRTFGSLLPGSYFLLDDGEDGRVFMKCFDRRLRESGYAEFKGFNAVNLNTGNMAIIGNERPVILIEKVTFTKEI